MQTAAQNTRGRARPRHRSGRGRGASTSTNGPAPTASASAPVPAPSNGFPAPVAGAEVETHITSKRFDSFGISPALLQAIPFANATDIQAETIAPALAGKDILARAKTGTGKTVAFLVPIVEQLLRSPPSPRSGVSALILSPTRELAQQIHEAANKLLAGTKFSALSVVGGTNVNSDASKLRNGGFELLIATPVQDLIDHHSLAGQLAGLRFFVLDEADRLLDQGFQPAIMRIMSSLPNRAQSPRQSLLFSATVSPEVRKVAAVALRPDHVYVSTIAEEESNVHEHVPQSVLRTSDADWFASLYAVLKDEIALAGSTTAKVMVFLPTARAAEMASLVFEQLPLSGLPTWSIHSRKSQAARTRTTEEFRVSPNGVLFSSDVTARGIDIPGVTAVVQASMPSSSDDYIHRLGRTARAGKTGRGVLVLTQYEASAFLNSKVIRDLSIAVYAPQPPRAQLDADLVTIAGALDQIPDDAKAQAYQAWLGANKTNTRAFNWTEDHLISQAAEYARVLRFVGRPEDGGLPPTCGKMGLSRHRSKLNVVQSLPGKEGVSSGRGPSGRGGGGGGGSGRGGAQSGGGGGPSRGGGRGRGRGRGRPN